jgi:uncharacterized protein (UPF0332 family)
MRPDEFIDLSNLVVGAGTPQTEPFFRSAVSRAYYAAHLTARELYLGRRKITPNASGIVTHRMMIRALKGSKLPGLGHQLDQLLDARLDADYNLKIVISGSELQTAMTIAQLILSDLPRSIGGRP